MLKDKIIMIDFETLGLVAGFHPVISIGAVAYQWGREISRFRINLEHEQEGLQANPQTLEWWKQFPDKFEETKVNCHHPKVAIDKFIQFCHDVHFRNGGYETHFAAYPAGFEAPFLWWYIYKHSPETHNSFGPFKRSRMIDVRSYVSAYFAVPYSEANRDVIPEEWIRGHAIDHNPINDCLWQGVVLNNILLNIKEQNSDLY